MSLAPTAALDRRLQAIRSRFAAANLDALVVTALPNVLYLTNFNGSSAIAVVTAEQVCFITDFRYVTAVRERQESPAACPSLSLVTVSNSYEEALAEVLTGFEGKRVGFEAADLTVARFNWLKARLGDTVSLVPTEGLVEQARVVKDPYEVGLFREAGRLLSEVALDVVHNAVRPGMTEREVALGIDTRIHRAGFEKTSFDTIVAAGPNAALPHARPGERRLADGDLVVLDFGGVYASYCVDLTRTVCLGPAGREARRVYEAVREAHDRAIAQVRPGVPAWSIDAAARDYLTTQGLGDAFGHGTGHGLGIEVHEAPRVSRRRNGDSGTDRLSAGMVFTIEPGAYIAGWGGVRIEDDVLVTDDSVEMLTEVTTELVEV